MIVVKRKDRKCAKRAYQTESDAVGAAKSLTKKDGAWMGVYRCSSCRDQSGRRLWHVGHQKPRSNPRRRPGRRP